METSPDSGDDAALDEAQALRNLGGNETLYLKMAAYFLTYAEELARPVRAARASRDWTRLRDANHKLMGSVVNFGKNRVYHAARQLEASLDAGRLARVEDESDAVLAALAALTEALRARLGRVDLPS